MKKNRSLNIGIMKEKKKIFVFLINKFTAPQTSADTAG